MDHDLTGILNHPTFRLEPAHIKHLAHQFFDALHYLHHRGVLHRDIKGSNILLNNDGNLKIADFGLARFYTKNSKKELDYTNRIITLWYRPPEILLGATAYGPAVDMWSAACVFIELFTRVPAFPGRTEIDQLDIIYKILGKPTEKAWPALKQMPWYSLLRTSGLNRKNKFRGKYERYARTTLTHPIYFSWMLTDNQQSNSTVGHGFDHQTTAVRSRQAAYSGGLLGARILFRGTWSSTANWVSSHIEDVSRDVLLTVFL